VGLVTLGNLLSRISHGRAMGASQVKEVMFDFSKIQEVVTDPRDIDVVEVGGGKQANANRHGEADEQDEESRHHKGQNKRRFIEITMNTPLSTLNRFFEWQSAAVVTERDPIENSAGGKGAMRPVAVVTKVDLLTWLLAQKKI
jgi:cystathionine beta-synthase